MIRVNDQYYLDAFRLEDKHRLAETINDVEIARNTLTIPHPYKLEDAEWWLTERGIHKNAGASQTNWALRNSDGLACGSISIHNKYGTNSHKDEIGYWLMRELWGQGLMTEVVKCFSKYCFEERHLVRLEAPIFEFNKGSARVLEKSGFECEGRLRNAYLKQGVYYDSFLYAKIAEQTD